MSERNERIYVGKARWQEFRNGSGVFKISLTPDGVEAINRNTSESGWANLEMAEMKQPDRQGNQYTVYLDDYYLKRSGAKSGNSRTTSQTVRPATRSARPASRTYNDGGFETSGGHKYSREDVSVDPQEENTTTENIDLNDIPF